MLVACAVAGVEVTRSSPASAFFWYCKLDAPSLSVVSTEITKINLRVCAGRSGAPGGFTIQWMKKSDFVDNCHCWYKSSDPRLCKAVFLPPDRHSPYAMKCLACLDVCIGGLPPDVTTNCPTLDPQTEYIFRVFAHGSGCWLKSNFSHPVCATTLPIGLPPS